MLGPFQSKNVLDRHYFDVMHDFNALVYNPLCMDVKAYAFIQIYN